MTLPPGPPPGSPYSQPDPERFDAVLSGALAATEALDDVVTTPSGSAGGAGGGSGAGPATDGADPVTAADVVLSGPDADGVWSVVAPSVAEAVQGCVGRLGPVDVVSATRSERGVGRWRRTRVEVRVAPRPLAQADLDAVPERARELEQSRAAEQFWAVMGEGEEPLPPLPDRVFTPTSDAAPARTQPFAATPSPHAPTPADEAAAPGLLPPGLLPLGRVSPGPGSQGSVSDGLRAALAAAESAARTAQEEIDQHADPFLPPPVLPTGAGSRGLPDIDRRDLVASWLQWGAPAELLTELDAVPGEDVLASVRRVVETSLACAGAIDPIDGGAIVGGVGPLGAVGVLVAARAGRALGDLVVDGHTGPTTAARLTVALTRPVLPR